MPRMPRNPGTGKAPVNLPAAGAGLHGPAKGFVENPNLRVRPGQTGMETLRRGPDGRMLPTERSVLRQAAADAAFADLVARAEAARARIAAATAAGKTPAYVDEVLVKDLAVAILNRAEGAPKQPVEATGKNGAPLFPSLALTIGTPGNE